MSRGWCISDMPSCVNFTSPPRNKEPAAIPFSYLHLLWVLSLPKGLEGFLSHSLGAPFTLMPCPFVSHPTPHWAELSPRRGS